MNKFKTLIPIVFVIFMGIGTYNLISSATSEQNEYKSNLNEARRLRKLGVIDDALTYYDLALEFDNSIDLYIEKAEMLHESNRIEEAIELGEDIEGLFKEDPKGYEFVISLYIEGMNYKDAYCTYDTASKYEVSSEKMDKMIEGIKYTYQEGATFEEVGVDSIATETFSVSNGEVWFYVDYFGTICSESSYQYAGMYCELEDSCVAPICDENGEWYYITSTGAKKYVVQNLDSCDYLGVYDGVSLVAHSSKGYGLYNVDFEPIVEGLDDITTMNGGIGAAKNSRGWYIIDSNGNQLLESYFDNIAIDDKGVCYRNDRFFVKKAGKWHLIDVEGNEYPTEKEISDACPFYEADGLAAVKMGDSWGYIDKDGNTVIKPKYNQARSFKNGFAAVGQGRTWGVINLDEEFMFDYQFQDVKELTSEGTLFVKKDGCWTLLTFYKFNH